MAKIQVEIPADIDYKELEKNLNNLIENYTKLRYIKDEKDRALRIKFLMKREFNQGRIGKSQIAVFCKVLNELYPVFNWFNLCKDILFIKVDHCHICNNKLHKQGIYPPGYPKNLKFCCGCNNLMRSVFVNSGNSRIKGNTEQIKKIEKAITLEVI